MANQSLIDWPLVGLNALWIVGLSMVLAALSWADYRATQTKTGLQEILKKPNYQMAINASMLFVCLGLAGLSHGWERLIWLGLALAFFVQAGLTWRALTSL